MPLKIDRPKNEQPIDEDTKLLMETLANIVPKDHPNYARITERAKAPVQSKRDDK